MSAVALAKHEDPFFTQEQINTIKSVLCKGISDSELSLFSQVCKQTRLSPFARQIYVTKRPTWDADAKEMVPKMTIQTGIDGFRLIAERTGKYRGQTPFQWCGDDGQWRDIWLSAKPPAAARAGVIRSDFAEPLYRTARWNAYVQTKKGGEPNSMWSKMGPEQLAKCAEALALRTAFPQELSGLYTDDEMGQADNPSVVEEKRPPLVKAGRSARSAAESSTIQDVTAEPGTSATVGKKQTPTATPTQPTTDVLEARFPPHWGFEDKKWAGARMDSVGAGVLDQYITELEQLLAKEKQGSKAHMACTSSLEKASYHLAGLLAKEARNATYVTTDGEVRDELADKIAEKLERPTPDETDTNDEYGLTAGDETP